jgi:hypothetical protein
MTDENQNLTGNVTAIFCDASSNSEFMNVSAFPDLYNIQLPSWVTCDCCSFVFSHNTTGSNDSTSTQQEEEQQFPAS